MCRPPSGRAASSTIHDLLAFHCCRDPATHAIQAEFKVCLGLELVGKRALNELGPIAFVGSAGFVRHLDTAFAPVEYRTACWPLITLDPPSNFKLARCLLQSAVFHRIGCEF